MLLVSGVFPAQCQRGPFPLVVAAPAEQGTPSTLPPYRPFRKLLFSGGGLFGKWTRKTALRRRDLPTYGVSSRPIRGCDFLGRTWWLAHVMVRKGGQPFERGVTVSAPRRAFGGKRPLGGGVTAWHT